MPPEPETSSSIRDRGHDRDCVYLPASRRRLGSVSGFPP